MLVGIVATLLLGAGLVATDTVELASSTPTVRFDYEYDASAETLTVTHWMGEGVDGERLTVVGGDGTDLGGWRKTRVTAGDSVTVSVPTDGTVRLVYEGPSGRTTIGTWQRPPQSRSTSAILTPR